MSIHYADQRFLILGAGVTGSAVAKALKSRGGLVTITDDNSDVAVKPESIDLSNFATGMYVLQLKTDNNTQTMRFVRE